MNSVRYLSAEEILAIHERVLEETGGLHGIRDLGLLFSIAVKPQTILGGEEMYQGLFVKAASLIESLIQYHVFSDGNKRTAFLATVVFLAMNGYLLKTSEKEAYAFVMNVTKKKFDLKEVAIWLKKHMRKMGVREY